MLVLSRKNNERILVNTPFGDMVISVVDIRRDKVRLGFDAPPEFRLAREEIVNVGDAAGEEIDY